MTEKAYKEKAYKNDKEEVLSLRAAEALSKDVGRAFARLDPNDFKKLGLEVGDIIQIEGKRVSVAKAMPAFSDARGKGIVQIDGIIRGNVGSSIGEKVSIKKALPQQAGRIVLTPAGGFSALKKKRDMDYMGRLLDGMPMVAGDRVRATLFGSRYQDFMVLSTTPHDVVIIHPQTIIGIEERKEEGTKELKITYEDVGGLSREVQKIREMIELPLRYPEVFEKLGIEPPKGVLLYGPPGCGKTLLAKAVANETEATFLSISGPEVIHKFYGESEAKLREVFETAKKNAPSIVFIDEIDSIAPKREQVVGDVEKRVVAQLLAVMDGLEGRGQVIVIGATNLPNLLDPALRRPGRFDREITIGIPDTKARREVLEIHTRGMPLANDVNLDELSEITHGFTGADIAALCREAAMITLRRLMPKIEFGSNVIPYELLMELEVTMDDVLSAMHEVEPSAIREVFVEIPNVKWKDIGGLEEIKEKLIETVEWPLKYGPLFKYGRLKPPKGVLLHGAPGTGKTLLAKALATEAGVNFISVKGPQLMSKYVGESERAVREVFKTARQASPCILFFDEIDSLAPMRGGVRGDSGVSDRVISQLLTEMDGIEELKNVWILAATNRTDMIDSALLRPGRFDMILELPTPDEKSRLKIFKIHTKERPIDKNVSLEKLAQATEGMVGADIEGICTRAAMLAVRDFVETMDVESNDYSSFKVGRSHFEKALEEFLIRK